MTGYSRRRDSWRRSPPWSARRAGPDRPPGFCAMCITRIGFRSRRIEPLQVHQHDMSVGRQHFGAGVPMIANAVLAHQARHGLFVHGKRPAEAAAFVGPLQCRQLQPVDEFHNMPALPKLAPTTSLHDASRNSRRPWQLWCRPTRVRKLHVDPRHLQHSVRNSQNSNVFAFNSAKPGRPSSIVVVDVRTIATQLPDGPTTQS